MAQRQNSLVSGVDASGALKTHVIAVPMNGKNGFTFDYSLNHKLPEIIRKYAESQPVLIVRIK